MALKKKFFYNLQKPFIIAEIASAHLGNKDNVIFLTKEAKKSGADAVKFQVFNTNEFVSRNNIFFKILKKIEINYSDWNIIFSKTKKINILKICEIFEYSSLVFAHKSNFFNIYKISSSDIYDKKIYDYLIKYKLPFVLNISGIEIKFLEKLLNKFKNRDMCVMLGFQNFPTKIKDINLSKIKYLKNKFKKTCLGFADHTDSNDYFFSHSIPLMALSMGAKVIEKHIAIDRFKKKNDYYSSLNPDEFKLFVENIKKASSSFGNKKYILSKSENKYMAFSKKYMVANKNIIKGYKLKKEDIAFKRVNKIGLVLNDFNKIKNKITNKNIKKDKMILLNDFE